MITQKLFQTAVITWVYNTLNEKYPAFFKEYSYKLDGSNIKVKNVYWADTMTYRPFDATECILTVKSKTSPSFGTTGSFYQDAEDKNYYNKLHEINIVDINFKISSMKNEKLGLNDYKAQLLVDEAISYLKTKLKSDNASDWFTWGNDIATPILVLTDTGNMSDITDMSVFEDTKNRFSSQFSCSFRYDYIDKEEAHLAQGAELDVECEGEHYTKFIEFKTE